MHYGPQPLKAILPELLARRGYTASLAMEEREQAWQDVVDGRFAARCMPGALQRGVLEIFVGDSVTLQELTFMKDELLHALQARLPQQQIREIRFRVGSLPE